MLKAKDCRRGLLPSMVPCLGLGFIVLSTGCTSLSGLRSIGAERPSLLGFWEKPAPSPTPENDLYVQSMRAGQNRAAQLAGRDKDTAAPSADTTDDATRVADASEDEPSRRRKDQAKIADRGKNTVRVSLGRPEPLPGAGLALASAGKPGSAESAAPSWKADAKPELAPEDVAELAGPIDRPRGRDVDPESADRSDESAPRSDWNEILAGSAAKLDALKTYQMRVSRLERVSGQLQPEEQILLSIRRAPKAVRLEWESGPSKGREVIFSSALDPRMLFVHMPPTTIPLPAMKIPVDSPLVMRNSRHAISEAGLETIVENLRKSGRDGETSSNAGVVSYKGTEKPSGLDQTCHHFVRVTPSGETWDIYLHERSLLPSMVVAKDSRGQLMERYIYREIRENPTDLTVAAAFEPDQRWGASNGLLGRLARAAAGTNQPASSSTTTR